MLMSLLVSGREILVWNSTGGRRKLYTILELRNICGGQTVANESRNEHLHWYREKIDHNGQNFKMGQIGKFCVRDLR